MRKEDLRLKPEQLRFYCDPASFPFSDTGGVEPLRDFVGQERAIEALRFGLEIEAPGYNIFATGLEGTGRNAVIREHLKRFVAERKAQGKCQVFDYCYIHNFSAPGKPTLLVLEKGAGKVLRQDLEECLSGLQKEIVAFFGSEEYQNKKQQILDELQRKNEETLRSLKEEARRRNIIQVQYPTGQMGWLSVSLADPQKPLHPLERASLPEDVRKTIESNEKEFQNFLFKAQREFHAFQREINLRIEKMEKQGVIRIFNNLFKPVLNKHRSHLQIVQYVKGLKNFVLRHLELFLPQPEMNHAPMVMMRQEQNDGQDPFLPFRINLLVDNSDTDGAPVVFETNPTLFNLFGRTERKPSHGTYFTDHTKIRAGSLLLANGGYLVVNMLDLILNPGVWQKLKRTLKTGELHFEDALEHLGLFPTEGLAPEPVPINVKVIVVGYPFLYNLLLEYDEDFPTIFKIKADFDSQMPLSEEHKMSYAGLIALWCQKEGLLPFDRTAVAKMVEYGMRLVGSQTKMSTLFGLIKNIIIESSYLAQKVGSGIVNAERVLKAIEAKRKRANLAEERLREHIREGTLLIDVSGSKIGQINALAVRDLGDISFGAPLRVTAKTFVGKPGVASIDRECGLGGQIFNKAILTLEGYLGGKYAQNFPLSVAVKINFEQSYGQIEGDSASLAELYAVLSSLSGLPLDQGLAVTGSMNQTGEVQPVGSINEKIEGFFDVCKELGLTGNQGVIIPHQNTKNLMLREDVVEAVRDGRFHVFAIKTAEDGIELVFGREAEDEKPGGAYPKDSVNDLVSKKLEEFAKKSRQFISQREEK